MNEQTWHKGALTAVFWESKPGWVSVPVHSLEQIMTEAGWEKSHGRTES